MTWKRTPREGVVLVTLPAATAKPKPIAVPNSGDSPFALQLSVLVRPVQAVGIGQGMVPPGTARFRFSSSIIAVPRDELRDTRFAFQAQLEVESPQPLIARPNVCGRDEGDWDKCMGELQYRDVYEYAVGHGVSTHASVNPDGDCHTVRTCWVPDAEVEFAEAEFVAPSEIHRAPC